MLAIEGLGKRFGSNHALTGVSAEIEDGSFVGVIGRSVRASRRCSAASTAC